jgi:hypothetical protein
VSPHRVLSRGLQLLTARVLELETRIQAGDASAWPDYCAALQTLAALDRPERGLLLKTSEMAERLGIQPKSLLRRARQGKVQPAVRSGKFIRWKSEGAR